MPKINKSLSSIQESYETSYSYEIKILREKVIHWKRASEMHYLEGFHISGALYKTYMEKAMQELSSILQKEQQEKVNNILKTIKPRKIFPVLSSFKILNRK